MYRQGFTAQSSRRMLQFCIKNAAQSLKGQIRKRIMPSPYRLMQNYCACHDCVARPLKILMYCRVHSAWVPDAALGLCSRLDSTGYIHVPVPPPSMEASGFSGTRALSDLHGRPPGTAEVRKTPGAVFRRPPGTAEVRKTHGAVFRRRKCNGLSGTIHAWLRSLRFASNC